MSYVLLFCRWFIHMYKLFLCILFIFLTKENNKNNMMQNSLFIFCKYTGFFKVFSFNIFFGILSFLESVCLTFQLACERPELGRLDIPKLFKVYVTDFQNHSLKIKNYLIFRLYTKWMLRLQSYVGKPFRAVESVDLSG